MLDGQMVADFWGGYLDPALEIPWQRHTLVNVHSVGKGVLALESVARGELDLDQRLAKRGPELAAEGKGSISLRLLLSHRAGLFRNRLLREHGIEFFWGCAVERSRGSRPCCSKRTAPFVNSNARHASNPPPTCRLIEAVYEYL
ncbi:MAG: class A beta-lactamase-related serine hydrolase [Gammaproteobacteria bacterium]|nr:MAG: class A beta-lactamase-related serine hydrolase [Gammaproteobacteria bacterium]